MFNKNLNKNKKNESFRKKKYSNMWSWRGKEFNGGGWDLLYQKTGKTLLKY